MSVNNAIFSVFHRLSKKFSREGLYTWLEKECAALQVRHAQTSCKILNVGSGGEIYEQIRKIANAEIVQTDIDPARNPDIVADVCDMPMFADETFDYVFMSEVLEHVKTPQAGIDEVFRVLKTDGTLYLSTPFLFPHHDEPYDFYRYTRFGLEHVLRNFKDVQIKQRNGYYAAILVLFARGIIHKDRKHRYIGLIVFMYMLMQYPLYWLLSKLPSNGKGTTGYTITARK
jgi:ubiquinone/menaquinone biosynthesis C-methylase UbiE